jgi:hypothetical protein
VKGWIEIGLTPQGNAALALFVIFDCAQRSESNPMARQEPIKIKYHRSRSLPRGFLIDDNLDDHSLDELREWAARKVNFVVIDSDTGEDITRIMLA